MAHTHTLPRKDATVLILQSWPAGVSSNTLGLQFIRRVREGTDLLVLGSWSSREVQPMRRLARAAGSFGDGRAAARIPAWQALWPASMP